MKFFLSLIVSSILLVMPNAQFGGKAGMGGNAGTGGGPSAGCTAPTLTSLWLPSALAGSSGKAGMNDSVGSNPATNSSNNPVYSAAGGPGSTPSLAFTAASSETLALASTIPTNWATYSGFAVFEQTTFSDQDFLGANGAGFQWYMDGGPEMSVTFNNTTMIGGPSTGYSTNTWYTEAWQWNPTSGAYTFWRCSGGTCSVRASGTTTTTVGSNGFAYIGSYAAFANYFNGSIAAMGIYNGTLDVTTLGTYTHCEGWN